MFHFLIESSYVEKRLFFFHLNFQFKHLGKNPKQQYIKTPMIINQWQLLFVVRVPPLSSCCCHPSNFSVFCYSKFWERMFFQLLNAVWNTSCYSPPSTICKFVLQMPQDNPFFVCFGEGVCVCALAIENFMEQNPFV